MRESEKQTHSETGFKVLAHFSMLNGGHGAPRYKLISKDNPYETGQDIFERFEMKKGVIIRSWVSMIIKKSDTFFMAVCVAAPHSFISMGVQQDNGECAMLVDVGKAIPRSDRKLKRNQLSILLLMLLGRLNSEIMNEEKLVYGINGSY